VEGVLVWKDANSLMTFISLNAGLVKSVETETIEENQEHLRNKMNDYFKGAPSGY